jgi:predicted dehydrogenase
MSDRPLRFGMVGAGGIAQAYVQVFRKAPEVELVAVADSRAQAARATAEAAGARWFDSHDGMAEGCDLDAVLVCTPPSTHRGICEWFLERGVPVICEKPVCPDSASARAVVALAEEKNVPFTMATKFRFADDVVRAKSLVASGVLGEVVLFENAFTARVSMAGRWNADPHVSGGGVIIDNGTHSVDVMRYFLGPIEEVFAVEGRRIQGLPVEDTARIFTRTVNGVLGNIDLSWSIQKELSSYVDVYGTHGVIRIGWKESKFRQVTCSDWVTFGQGYDKIQSMSGPVRNFARSIRGEEKLVVDGEDAIASVDVIEAVYRALDSSQWTKVNGYGTADRREVPREAQSQR